MYYLLQLCSSWKCMSFWHFLDSWESFEGFNKNPFSFLEILDTSEAEILCFKIKFEILLGWGLVMAGGGDGTSRQLDQTPTWAVAGVCAVIILISIALEKILHKLGTVWWHKNLVFLCFFNDPVRWPSCFAFRKKNSWILLLMFLENILFFVKKCLSLFKLIFTLNCSCTLSTSLSQEHLLKWDL